MTALFGVLLGWLIDDWLTHSFIPYIITPVWMRIAGYTVSFYDEWYVFKAVHSFYRRLSQQGTFTKLHLKFGSAKNITIIIAGTDNLGIVFRSLPPSPPPFESALLNCKYMHIHDIRVSRIDCLHSTLTPRRVHTLFSTDIAYTRIKYNIKETYR